MIRISENSFFGPNFRNNLLDLVGIKFKDCEKCEMVRVYTYEDLCKFCSKEKKED